MMAALGIVVGLGSILGGILSESGATDQLALSMLRKFGSKRANAALNASGYLISIPVFMGPAYIILNPICKTLAKYTKKNVIGYTTALVVGIDVYTLPCNSNTWTIGSCRFHGSKSWIVYFVFHHYKYSGQYLWRFALWKLSEQ